MSWKRDKMMDDTSKVLLQFGGEEVSYIFMPPPYEPRNVISNNVAFWQV